MSYADDVFIRMCKDILENGTSTEGEKVRPKWEDGTSAYTIKQFGVVNRYDLSKELPAITLRKTAIKSCTDESRDNVRIVRVRDTVNMEYLSVSENMAEEMRGRDDIEIISEPHEISFGADGYIIEAEYEGETRSVAEDYI